MLKNSSRETFMKNIYNIGEIGKSERYLSLLLFFCLVSVIFCWFFRRQHKKNVKAEQGFRLCLYQETWDTNQGFQVPVTAGVLE